VAKKKRKAQTVDWFDMEEIPYKASRLLKALGNPKAYALVRLLLREEVLTVEEMSWKRNRSPWAISKILRPLRDLEVVRYQKKGRHSLYTLKDRKGIQVLVDGAEGFARRTRAAD
jgi:DNA-binding transcriptional ArsR family regulator